MCKIPKNIQLFEIRKDMEENRLLFEISNDINENRREGDDELLE